MAAWPTRQRCRPCPYVCCFLSPWSFVRLVHLTLSPPHHHHQPRGLCTVLESRRELHSNRHLHVSVPCSELATAETPTVALVAFSHHWPAASAQPRPTLQIRRLKEMTMVVVRTRREGRREGGRRGGVGCLVRVDQTL